MATYIGQRRPLKHYNWKVKYEFTRNDWRLIP